MKDKTYYANVLYFIIMIAYIIGMTIYIIYMLIDIHNLHKQPVTDTYDYRIYHPIEVSNRDSTMMMCYVRNTKGSRDTLWRLRNKL